MRLIDADALIHTLETQDYSGAPNTLEDWTPEDMTKAEIADIQNAPTVDAEPVIRCKDCKFGKWCSYVDMNGETETVIACQAYEVQKDIDGFCDEGERRGEEDE